MTVIEPEVAPTPTIEVVTAQLADITTVAFGLPADFRCEVCAAQGYVEIEVKGGLVLIFCAHHYAQHEDSLVLQATRIVDHRPHLYRLEGRAAASK